MNPLPLHPLLCRGAALPPHTLRPASPGGAARAASGSGSGSPRRARLTTWLALALLALSPLPSHLSAQTVPALVNYQGRLANPDGSPLPTADYTLTFNVYDAATNGALVWGPQVFDGAVAAGHGARIPVVQGYFNVMLGPVDASGSPRPLADAFNGPSRYVEVTVSNRPPIAPRQQILTTPFAFQAANSTKLAGYDWSAVFGTNDPVAGTIPFSKLAQRPTGTNVPAGGFAVSTVVSNFTTGSSVLIPVTNLTVTITTTGRPVYVGFRSLPTGTNTITGYQLSLSGGSAFYGELRDQTSQLAYYSFYFGGVGTIDIPPSAISHIYLPPAGTYTYTLNVATDAGRTLHVSGQMIAFEL